MKKIFVIIIEPGVLDVAKHTRMIEALKKDDGIFNWWHHITNSYILITKTNVSAKSLQKFVKFFFNSAQFLVIEIPRVSDYNGWLPDRAWKWIENNTK